MKTIKETKYNILAEYNRFCSDMLYDTKNEIVKQGFAEHFIEHYIGCFGWFNNDYFIIKDMEQIKNEIIGILKEV